MAQGVNKVILVGNLGRDPEVRYMASGSAVTTISVATTFSWKDKQSGERQDRTEWHRVVFFNRLAEIAGEYLRKGSKVYIEGSLRTNKWQDKNGQEKYSTDIVASEMQLLDSRGREQDDFRQTEQYRSTPSQQDDAPPPPPPTQETQAQAADNNHLDDDIPF